MLMRVKPKETTGHIFEYKPGKNETSYYFRPHGYYCMKCDSKRVGTCDHKNNPKL